MLGASKVPTERSAASKQVDCREEDRDMADGVRMGKTRKVWVTSGERQPRQFQKSSVTVIRVRTFLSAYDLIEYSNGNRVERRVAPSRETHASKK